MGLGRDWPTRTFSVLRRLDWIRSCCWVKASFACYIIRYLTSSFSFTNPSNFISSLSNLISSSCNFDMFSSYFFLSCSASFSYFLFLFSIFLNASNSCLLTLRICSLSAISAPLISFILPLISAFASSSYCDNISRKAIRSFPYICSFSLSSLSYLAICVSKCTWQSKRAFSFMLCKV